MAARPEVGSGRGLPARPSGGGAGPPGDAPRRGRPARLRARPEGHPVRLRASPMSASPRTRIRIGPRSAGISLTPEEFDDLWPHAFRRGFRYELIRGVLVVTPRPLNG